MRGFLKSFLGDEPVNPNRTGGEEREETSLCGLFHLKTLWLFSENFSSEP